MNKIEQLIQESINKINHEQVMSDYNQLLSKDYKYKHEHKKAR